MNPKFLALPCVAVLAAATTSRANPITPAQTQIGTGQDLPTQADYLDQQATDADYAPFSPSDSDLGVQEILSPYSGRSPVLFDFQTAVYRTDNAPSGAPATDEPSWFWTGRAAVAWRPRLFAGFFGDFAISEDFARFDDSAAYDYENTAVTAGLVKFIPQLDDLLVFGRYEYQRLTSGSLSDSDYFAHRIRLGARKVIFASPRHELSLGADIAFDLGAKQETLERNEYAADLAYRFFLTDELYTMLTWRASKFDFDTKRDDWCHAVGLELIWEFTRDARAHISLFYDLNDSNTPLGANDYEAWSGGIGAGLTFRF